MTDTGLLDLEDLDDVDAGLTRADFGRFCERVIGDRGYAIQPHQWLLIRELEAVARGETKRLMVFMPPGAAKSTYASELFPAWFLATQPRQCVVGAAHTNDFAETFSKKVMAVAREYCGEIGYYLSSENMKSWTTTNGGEYKAVGIGSNITGRRGDLVLIDDPVRSYEDAQSETYRAIAWNWYLADVRTRAKPGMRVVVIMTRWHENDLAGRLLEAQAHDWRVVRLPAMAEDNDALGRKPGEMLWGDDPKWPWAEEARAIKSEFDRSGASRTWSALYQQNPVPDTGSYFLRQWLVPVPSLPPVSALKIYGASDYAVTAAGGDYTVHVVVGMDADGRLWILDLWREQTTADEWVEAFCALVKRWKPLAWAEEGGQIKASVGPFLTRTMRERRAYVHRVDFPTRGDKAIRAQSIRGRMAVDGIRYLATAEWRGSFEREILSFPVGKHDDQCLIEGTLITMADGSRKPIEAVRIGDVVATHEGPCDVEACGVTDEAADVMQVAFSDGSVLTGTPNHPVHVVGRGFVSLGSLGIMDQITTDHGQCDAARQRRMWWNIGGIGIGDTLKANTFTMPGITRVRNQGVVSFIGIYGKMRTALSRRNMISTTRTGTLSTTTYQTLNVSKKGITNAFISAPLTKPWANISLRSAPWRGLGILAQRGWLGISNMVRRVGTTAQLFFTRSALLAVPGSMPFLNGPCFAAAGASSGASVAEHPSAGDLWRKVKRSFAGVARACSPQNGLRSLLIAQKPAVCVIEKRALSEKARVLNLTVSRAHAFYANGVLTHNCDALGLVGQLLDRMEKPVAPKPVEPIRGTMEMTMSEAWKLANPRTLGGKRVRI